MGGHIYRRQALAGSGDQRLPHPCNQIDEGRCAHIRGAEDPPEGSIFGDPRVTSVLDMWYRTQPIS